MGEKVPPSFASFRRRGLCEFSRLADQELAKGVLWGELSEIEAGEAEVRSS